MTSGGGFIDFFVLEANEYIEQLDGLMLQARDGAPDGDAVQRTGRALRGAATMAKLPAFAELAAAVEGIGRASRDGVIEWNAALRAAMISAVDDFKILVRGARNWGEAEVQRAEARKRELASFAPAPRRSSAVAAQPAPPGYLVGEANNIAAGLELLVTRPDHQAGAGAVLSRVRALRGVAGIKDLPPLPEVAEAAENAARPLELGEPRLSIERVELLRASAVLLRRIAAALREGRPTSEPSAEYEQFVAASERLENAGDDSGRIVPIASLFFDDDGPHVVSQAPNPPTTPKQRFRMEAVSLAEHLKGLVAAVRSMQDPQERERARRDLRRSLRNIRQAAESFGEDDVVRLITSQANVADTVDEASLAQIERIVQTIAYPDAPVSPSAPTPIVQRPAVPKPPPTPIAPMTPVTAHTPAAPMAPVRPTPAVPTAAMGAASALDEGIASLDSFAAQPFAEPAPIEEAVVPIDALVYRGRAAVERAVQLRDQIRQAGGTPAPELLSELFDLLDLALAE
jgi:chemotaxis protein histidine kinase CheA